MNPSTPPAWHKAHDTLCAHGDSPFWHPQEERLYWVDRALRRLWRLHPRSGHAEHLELPGAPGSVAPCRSGGLLLALHDGIYHLANWADVPRKIRAAPFDTTHQHFGQGRCDAWGRFWVGTEVGPHDRPAGGLYCLQTRTQVEPALELMDRGVFASAGLAWSPDGRTVYWGDGARHDLGHLSLADPGHWPPRLGMSMPWARFGPRPADWTAERPQGYEGQPRGAAVDQNGHYWVAMFEGGQVLCLDDRGQVLQRIPTPTPCPTDLCFGGEDRRTLYLTTARLHRSTEELARHPDSGAVFALQVPTPGLPTAVYWD